jgi:hypothetical protein
MSVATVLIPDQERDAIRASLGALRQQAPDTTDGVQRRNEVDALLAQLDAAPAASEPLHLTGSRTVLWDAAYDILCTAAERFATDCNEIWRGGIDIDEARIQLGRLGQRLGLLGSLEADPATR